MASLAAEGGLGGPRISAGGGGGSADGGGGGGGVGGGDGVGDSGGGLGDVNWSDDDALDAMVDDIGREVDGKLEVGENGSGSLGWWVGVPCVSAGARLIARAVVARLS